MGNSRPKTADWAPGTLDRTRKAIGNIDEAEAEKNAETDLQAKKDELGKKAFEANKRTEIANVWINTASAILKSYAQMGWVAGSVASSLLLATAGVQTATINQQQYTPALAEGGIIDRPTTALIGEDGKEAVVPLERNLEIGRASCRERV